jgi:hypothetical protein
MSEIPHRWCFTDETIAFLKKNIGSLFKGSDPLTDEERYGCDATAVHRIADSTRKRRSGPVLEDVRNVAFTYFAELDGPETVLVCKARRTLHLTHETAKIMRLFHHDVVSVTCRTRIAVCTVTTVVPGTNTQRYFVAAVATTADRFTRKVLRHAAFEKAMMHTAKEMSADDLHVFDTELRNTLRAQYKPTK